MKFYYLIQLPEDYPYSDIFKAADLLQKEKRWVFIGAIFVNPIDWEKNSTFPYLYKPL